MRKRLIAILSISLLAGTFFAPIAQAALTVTTIHTSTNPVALAEDQLGNIYIGDESNADSTKNGLVVIPASSGTLFGQSVTAGTAKTLVSVAGIKGIAVTTSGVVVYNLSSGNLYALSSTNTTLFGVSITANTATLVKTSTGLKGGMDFDAQGNLYGVAIATGTLSVLPVSTGTLYGVAVTANTSTLLFSNASYWFWDLALDSSGNIFIADGWGLRGVFVIPKTTTTLFGQSVTASTFARMTTFGTTRYSGIDVDSNNVLYANNYGVTTRALSSTSQTLFETAVTANTATSLSGTSGYINQGLMVLQNGNFISGTSSGTLRIAAPVVVVDSTAPTLSAITFTVNENLSTPYTAATITLSESSTISSISGTDIARFNLLSSDSTTVVINFKSSPDFENPIDGGGNNVYEVSFVATDLAGNATSSQVIAITVANVLDTSAFNSLTLAGSVTTATFRTSIVITASVSVASKVTFRANGRVIPGCKNRTTSSSGFNFTISCPWKPSMRGHVTVLATADPVTDGISNVTSSPISVGVINRAGNR